jgi:hypothetical protein
MVHGACSSRGCYSMTDESIEEIYALGRLAFEGGQRDFQVQAFPFRMTAENLARHRNDPNLPFWLMLKEGYDHFDLVGQPPKVDVCDRRYVFNSVPAEGSTFDPTAACPPMSMPDSIRIAAAEKESKDRERMLSLAARLDRKERRNGLAALTVALATPTTASLAIPMSVAVAAAAPTTPEPAQTASVQALTSVEERHPAAGELDAVAAIAPPAAAAPQPRPAAAPPAQSAAAAAAPAAAGADVLPLPAIDAPDPASDQAAAPQQETRPQTPPSDPEQTPATPEPATIEERMLVESAPPAPGVANAYASAAAEEGGLTGLVLRLYQQP